jgi:hypothetical protein
MLRKSTATSSEPDHPPPGTKLKRSWAEHDALQYAPRVIDARAFPPIRRRSDPVARAMAMAQHRRWLSAGVHHNHDAGEHDARTDSRSHAADSRG